MRPRFRESTFGLVVCAITLNAFVTFGLSAVLIELLRAEGLAPAQALAFGSMLGVIQVSARGLDFLGGGRWDGITTGLVAGTALPVAMLLMMVSEGATWAVAVFILLYGAGSGAMAVARATIPLVFYDQAEFAKAMSMIALPLNLASRHLAAASGRPAHPVRQPRRARSHLCLLLCGGADPGAAGPATAAGAAAAAT